jgi:hypothetical protein
MPSVPPTPPTPTNLLENRLIPCRFRCVDGVGGAEELAIQNGCDHIHLDTFDFQARGFYKKNGFHVFGVIEDYPIGPKGITC